MSDYMTISYGFDYTIKLGDNKQWYVTQEDIRKNTIEELLDFAASPKILARRMIEDDKAYGEWLDAQKFETHYTNMRQSFN